MGNRGGNIAKRFYLWENYRFSLEQSIFWKHFRSNIVQHEISGILSVKKNFKHKCSIELFFLHFPLNYFYYNNDPELAQCGVVRSGLVQHLITDRKRLKTVPLAFRPSEGGMFWMCITLSDTPTLLLLNTYYKSIYYLFFVCFLLWTFLLLCWFYVDILHFFFLKGTFGTAEF